MAQSELFLTTGRFYENHPDHITIEPSPSEYELTECFGSSEDKGQFRNTHAEADSFPLLEQSGSSSHNFVPKGYAVIPINQHGCGC